MGQRKPACSRVARRLALLVPLFVSAACTVLAPGGVALGPLVTATPAGVMLAVATDAPTAVVPVLATRAPSPTRAVLPSPSSTPAVAPESRAQAPSAASSTPALDSRPAVAGTVISALATPRIVVLPTPTLPVLDAGARAQRFDQVWQTVQDHYLYADFHGVDWRAMRDHFRPRALAAPSAEGFYDAIREMVATLNDGHSRFVSPQEAFGEQAVVDGTESYVGIGVDIAPYTPGGIIETVFRDSPAEQAGLRRRDRILLVDGVPFGQRAASLRGPEGTRIGLRVKSPGQPAREVVVERRKVVAKRLVVARRVASTRVAYLLIQSFFPDDTGEQLHSVLAQLLAQGPLDGLIVDVRGNSGGWRHVLEEALASFVRGNVGAFYTQRGATPLDVKPNDLYERLAATPVVVLVDQASQSYSEVFAAVLQAMGRARIVGSATAGNTESIYAYDFDDKSRLWVAQEGFRLPSGRGLEGRGVAPDVTMDLNWLLYSEATDPHILKALQLINQSRSR